MSVNPVREQMIPAANKVPAKAMVVTGASGGHIFPALAFLEKLKEKHNAIDVILVLPQTFCRLDGILEHHPQGSATNSLAERIDNLGYKIEYLPVSALKLNFSFKNLTAIFNFLKATLAGIVLLMRFRPEVVVAFGSIICVPVVFFAWIFRIKIILHEQNVIPGRANRFLAKIADKIAVSFSESYGYLNLSPNRIVLTGNPLRASLKEIDKREARRFFALSETKFTILVTGGSQGSHKINLCFQQAFSELPGKGDLQVIHLAGSKDYDLLRQSYKGFPENVKLFDFFKDMQYAYNASDLVITRTGATTISEVILFKLPAIIIPYPYAYQHQLANARVLERRGLGVVIEDSRLDAQILKNTLENMLNNRQKLKDMRAGYERLDVSLAAERLVESALSVYQ